MLKTFTKKDLEEYLSYTKKYERIEAETKVLLPDNFEGNVLDMIDKCPIFLEVIYCNSENMLCDFRDHTPFLEFF